MENGTKKNIVCFALPAWEAEYSRSTVELMKCLSAENKVLYVDYAYTFMDLIKGITGKKKFDWTRLVGIQKRLRAISNADNTVLYVLSLPPMFPAFVFKNYKLFVAANRLNAAIAGYFINKAIKKLEMQDIIYFNSFQPFLGRHLKIIRKKFSVFYVYDDFSAMPYFNGFSELEEKEFIKQADLIIVSSAELKKRRAHIQKPIEVVNNGVHFKEFNSCAGAKKTNEKYIKTVGYTGTVDSRIAIDVLEQVVSEMPLTRFLFVGKVMDKAIHDRLSKHINVVFEPPVAACQVPSIQGQMHVGIIPYVCSSVTAAIYPLKINEYLAMGLPVVMTPFASIGEVDELIYRAGDAKAFKQAINLALTENDTPLYKARIDAAKKADWKMRSVRLMHLITLCMQQKNETMVLHHQIDK